MARNIEFKARVDSLAAVWPRAAALADGPPALLRQDDTFFGCAQGRLKLRCIGGEGENGSAELIQYDRTAIAGDPAAPLKSDYRRVPVAERALLRDALARACGRTGRVRKQRWLFLAGSARIHLDTV